MKVRLFTLLCLDEDEHPDLNLYRHFIDHYKDIGIASKNFYVVPCGVDSFKENFEEFKEINNQHQIPNLKLITKKWDMDESYNIYLNWCKEINPEDWVTRPDQDEFNDYGRFDKIQNCAEYLERNNYTALRGELLDCISADLILHKVKYPNNLFEQFPIRTNLTKHALSAESDKILLFKAKVNFQPGHHSIVWNPDKLKLTDEQFWAKPPRPTPGVYDTKFKSFHFKWTSVLIDRLKNKDQKNMYSTFDRERKKTKNIISGDRFNIKIDLNGNFIIH